MQKANFSLQKKLRKCNWGRARLHSESTLFRFPDISLPDNFRILCAVSEDVKATSGNLAKSSGNLALISMLISSRKKPFENWKTLGVLHCNSPAVFMDHAMWQNLGHYSATQFFPWAGR